MIRHYGDHLKARHCGMADSASHQVHFSSGTKLPSPALATDSSGSFLIPKARSQDRTGSSRTDAEEQWRRDVSHAPSRCCCRAWLLLWQAVDWAVLSAEPRQGSVVQLEAPAVLSAARLAGLAGRLEVDWVEQSGAPAAPSVVWQAVSGARSARPGQRSAALPEARATVSVPWVARAG